MEEGLKREIVIVNIQNIAYYNVYKTATGFYTTEEICREFHVGNENRKKIIKENNCYSVTEEDLKKINTESVNGETRLIPNYMTIIDLQLVLSFNVYVDINHDRKYYVSDSICARYNIAPLSKRIINGATFCNVTEDDLTIIEDRSVGEKVRLKRNYIEIELEDEMRPAENLFLLYTDCETNKYFIGRDMLDLLRKKGIEIEGTPKIINDKNCYSITENQLKEVEKTINYRGVEQILKPLKIELPEPKQYPSENQIQGLVDQIYSFNTREELFKKISEYDNSKVDDSIQPYLDRITPPESKESINKEKNESNEGEKETIINTFAPLVKEKPIIIYRNKKSNKLYIPTEEENATITIMHKPCHEISFDEINKLNKKTIIANVYVIEKEEYNIIICNHLGQLFISHAVLSNLGFYIENPYRISVNKEIYEEITREDIELIKGLESDNCHINIIEKNITPKRG